MLNKFRKCGAVFSKATASLCVAFSGSSYTLAAFGHAVAEAKESTSSEETTRIVVSTADASKVQDVAIGQYDNTYLLEYSSKEEAAKAYEEFSKDDSIQADYDYSFQVADNKSSESSSGTESSVNSLSELENVLKSNDNLEKADGKVIAVIDTKVTLDNDNIIGNVSMLGDETSTSNEHGNKVVSKILETNPDAKILAVEAIGGNGKGS